MFKAREYKQELERLFEHKILINGRELPTLYAETWRDYLRQLADWAEKIKSESEFERKVVAIVEQEFNKRDSSKKAAK